MSCDASAFVCGVLRGERWNLFTLWVEFGVLIGLAYGSI